MTILSAFNPSACSRKRGNTTPESTHQLVFPGGWKTGPIFDQYDDIFPCKDISRLQLRRDSSGLVHHRFIVLHMKDGALHRFDRRPGVDTGRMAAGCPVVSLDECVANLHEESGRAIENQSLCEIELLLDGANDILAVLSTCYAISQDEKARYYSLFEYNCFFFSWTILMVASRQCLPQSYPLRDSIMQNYASAAPKIIARIVKHYIDLGEYMLIHLTLVLRDEVQRTVPPKQLSGWWKTLVLLPPVVVKAVWKAIVGSSSPLALNQIIWDAIEGSFQPILLEIWRSGQSQVDLDSTLWLNSLQDTVAPFVNKQIVKRIWDMNKERLDAVCDNIETEPMIEKLAQRQKPWLCSGDIWEVRAPLIRLMYSAVSSLRDTFATQPRPDDIDIAVMFDVLWRTGSATMQSTMAEISNNPPDGTRDQEKWKQNWDLASRVIMQAADKAQSDIRSRVCTEIDGIIDMATQFSVDIVTQSLREDKTHVLNARLLKSETRRGPRYSEVSMTNHDIQDHIQMMMKAGTKDAGAYNAIHSSMSNVWAAVKSLPQGSLTEEK
ncbi:hypothetical protein FRC06_006255 [Ceratobasidium sp. 370]|nr:hypothetical protein FRC06_006255 [Ceratobasidium sp. 370]